MKNYVIARKNLLMNSHWIYALSVEGRKAFDKANKDKKIKILLQLIDNGNISMPKLLSIMSK
tara:strand:- start:1102 stop:1287 length:186 start_codon:yes stop_codon:yes gene_type:complete